MVLSIRDYTKIRRAEQAGTLIGVRLQPSALARLDAWIRDHSAAALTRPEAIRRLIDLGLSAATAGSEGQDRASEIRDLGKEHGPGIVEALQGAAADGNATSEERKNARRVLKQHGHPAKRGG